MLISIAEYAKKHKKSSGTIRQSCIRGRFQSARKIGRNWVIEEDEPFADNRIKSGKYTKTGPKN